MPSASSVCDQTSGNNGCRRLFHAGHLRSQCVTSSTSLLVHSLHSLSSLFTPCHLPVSTWKALCLPLASAKPSSPSLPSHLHKKTPHHTRQSSSASTTSVSSPNPCSILPSLSSMQHSPAFLSTTPLTCSVPAQHPPPANQIPYNNSASSAFNCPCHILLPSLPLSSVFSPHTLCLPAL